MAYTVEFVSYSDAPGLSQTMMRAMNRDPHYNLLLGSATTEELIANTGLRLPYNLSNNRGLLRHEKVVHTATGDVVGYARWELPETETHSFESAWLDTQMPAPTEAQQKSFRDKSDSTQIDGKQKIFNYEMGAYIGPVLGKPYNELVKDGGPYLGRSTLPLPA